MSLVAACLPALSQDWPSVVAKYGPSVGKIELRDGEAVLSSGSCFLVDKDGGLLTSAHVVQDAAVASGRSIVVTFPYGSASREPKEYLARIEAIDEGADLDVALLRIDGSFEAACELASGGEPPIMSEVLVIGFPLGMSFKSTPGFIQAYQDVDGLGRMLDLSAQVDPGNSGGPVFAKDGKVVGIVTAKFFGHNFNLALPIRDAIDFMRAGKEKVTIASDPEGARVYVNGIYRGLSPLTVEMIRRDAPLILEKDGFAASESRIEFKDGVDPSVSVKLVPAADPSAVALRIATKPAGARIFVDNVEMGTAPLELKAKKGSKLRIKLILRGYKDFYTELVVGASGEQELEYSLKKAGLF